MIAMGMKQCPFPQELGCHSTLVWQPPIVKWRIIEPGARLQEQQRSALDKRHDDDDVDDDDDDDDEVHPMSVSPGWC